MLRKNLNFVLWPSCNFVRVAVSLINSTLRIQCSSRIADTYTGWWLLGCLAAIFQNYVKLPMFSHTIIYASYPLCIDVKKIFPIM